MGFWEKFRKVWGIERGGGEKSQVFVWRNLWKSPISIESDEENFRYHYFHYFLKNRRNYFFLLFIHNVAIFLYILYALETKRQMIMFEKLFTWDCSVEKWILLILSQLMDFFFVFFSVLKVFGMQALDGFEIYIKKSWKFTLLNTWILPKWKCQESQESSKICLINLIRNF